MLFVADATSIDCIGRDFRLQNTDIIGITYNGTTATTIGGLTCQRWDSQTPHSHSWGLNEEENYCRNIPDFEEKPWCYTVSSGTRWDYCDVPLCI